MSEHHDREHFLNRLRILISIDLHELQAVGVFAGANHTLGGAEWQQWCRFNDNPYRFLIKCDDEIAAKIWTIIERRS